MTPGQQCLARRRAERAAQYAAELAESEANGGKVALPDEAEIAAAKLAAEAERTRLESLAAKEKDATAKKLIASAATDAAAKADLCATLERIAKDAPTKEDEELLAKMQEQHEADCEAKRAWLEKNG
jgi:hypothetical protein